MSIPFASLQLVPLSVSFATKKFGHLRAANAVSVGDFRRSKSKCLYCRKKALIWLMLFAGLRPTGIIFTFQFKFMADISGFPERLRRLSDFQKRIPVASIINELRKSLRLIFFCWNLTSWRDKPATAKAYILYSAALGRKSWPLVRSEKTEIGQRNPRRRFVPPSPLSM